MGFFYFPPQHQRQARLLERTAYYNTIFGIQVKTHHKSLRLQFLYYIENKIKTKKTDKASGSELPQP